MRVRLTYEGELRPTQGEPRGNALQDVGFDGSSDMICE